jgi:DNA topoisomerase-2
VYSQRWDDNMTACHPPKIRPAPKRLRGKSYTRVRFAPDLAYFKQERLSDDFVSVVHRRTMDLAGTTRRSLSVYYNGRAIKAKCFRDYARLFLKDAPHVHAVVNDRWEVVVAASRDGALEQVSYVNNIATLLGGTHVDHVLQGVVGGVMKQLASKRDKDGRLKAVRPHHVRNYVRVFVNSLVENPKFDSQSKTRLTSRVGDFGSRCDFDDKTLEAIGRRSGIMEAVVNWASRNQTKTMSKTDGRKTGRITGIPKLDDANWAGRARSAECTLILTEGDSAKALAVSGLAVVGRDKYGVFPLKGKLLNVRDATAKTVQNNEEIKSLKIIMGLKQGCAYETDAEVRSLRYGRVMVMTDQDHDGSHIKGLLVNLFAVFWPALLQRCDFLVEFVTPIVKCTRGREVRSFYTMPEYEAFEREAAAAGQRWESKYYKGLGTSTAAEGREYFRDLARHTIRFRHDGDACDDAVRLAFDKKLADRRKEWVNAADRGAHLDMNVDEVSYTDFVHKELVLYSMASNTRAIPSAVDGLKPGQRKVLWSAFKRRLTRDIKVAQLSGYVSENAAYHHGEVSLHCTSVWMAQNLVGSNNVNLLVPQGQFGTRAEGGKDHASPRYIFTRLEPLTRAMPCPKGVAPAEWPDVGAGLFPAADDAVLAYTADDGDPVEPEHYVPLLPMVLVNGAEGIGTGYSTSVPMHDPRELTRHVRALLDGAPLDEPLMPWYRGFTGEVAVRRRPATKRSPACDEVVTRGRAEDVRGDGSVWRITELPVGTWTQATKLRLGNMPEVRYFDENHTDTRVDFTVHMSSPVSAAQAHTLFRLESAVSTTNMVLFDERGQLRRYHTTKEILRDFVRVRLECYARRREHQLKAAREQHSALENRARFIASVVGGAVVIHRRDLGELRRELEACGYKDVPSLLGMPLRQLTQTKVDEFKAEMDECVALVRRLDALTPVEMYRAELAAVEPAVVAACEPPKDEPAEPTQKKTKKRKREAKASSSGGALNDMMRRASAAAKRQRK